MHERSNLHAWALGFVLVGCDPTPTPAPTPAPTDAGARPDSPVAAPVGRASLRNMEVELRSAILVPSMDGSGLLELFASETDVLSCADLRRAPYTASCTAELYGSEALYIQWSEPEFAGATWHHNVRCTGERASLWTSANEIFSDLGPRRAGGHWEGCPRPVITDTGGTLDIACVGREFNSGAVLDVRVRVEVCPSE